MPLANLMGGDDLLSFKLKWMLDGNLRIDAELI